LHYLVRAIASPVNRAFEPPPPLAAWQVLPAIAGIYISQTIVTAITTQALPSLLRNAGASLTLIGFTSLLWLPWGVRFLWAQWVERWRLPANSLKRRSRSLILLGQCSIAAVLLTAGAVAWIGQWSLASHAPWILGALLLAALVAASSDVACDGFTVEQLASSRRGWGNVAQVGGSYVGGMLGAGGFLLLAAIASWPQALMAAAAAIALLSCPLWLLREPTRQALAVPQAEPHHPSLLHALRRPSIRMGLLLLLLCSMGVRLSFGMLGPFLLDNGLGLEQVGWLFGTLHITAGLTGAFMGGLLVRHAPGWQAVWLAAWLKAAVLLALTLAALTAAPLLLLQLLVGLFFAALGCLWVALYAALMGMTSPLQAGLDFTLFQSADALLAMAGGISGGYLAGQFGYFACFALAAVLTLVAIAVVRWYARFTFALESP